MSDVSRVEAIYLDALQKVDLAERAAHLDAACGSDTNLRGQVEQLLAAHSKAGRFLEPEPLPTSDFVKDTEGNQPITSTIIADRYKLLEKIGEGGMGEVWVAEQTQPVKRKVAVKLIKAGMDSRAVLARFEAERQALAVMDHPNIAKVLDGGLHEGRPYFVMELVKGIPITEYCDRHCLTLQERLQLFVPVCQAIQHAHQKGVIHRDIKPSNVMVALYDDRPIPKVIDFGVAKATGQTLTEMTLHTGFGSVVGTPEYMSPEQASFNNLDIDTRSDVYSLGVLLYELLTGTTPVDRKSLGEAAVLEVLRIVREVEAPRPSLKLSTTDALPSIAASRGTEPTKLPSMMRGELDWIVLKALEKDRGRRYESANGLAADVSRYLSGEAVAACPPTLGYRLRKAYRRNRGAVLTAIAFISLLFVAFVTGTVLAIQAIRAQSIAEDQRIKAELNAQRAEEAKQLAVNAQMEADKQRNKALEAAYTSSMSLAARAWEDNNTPRVQELLKSIPNSIGNQDPRGFEWHYLSRVSNSALKTLSGHSGGVNAVDISPDGRLIATGSVDRTVKVWSYETGAELFTTSKMGSIAVLDVAFSPDGKYVAGCGSETFVWDSTTGKQLMELKGHTHFAASIAYSQDGRLIATASLDGTAKIWDGASGKELASFDHSSKYGHGGYLSSVAFSPDGKRLASASRNGTIKIWDVETSNEVLCINHSSTSLTFSPDGAQLASGGSSCKIWNSNDGSLLLTINSAIGNVNDVSFSADGKLLAGGCEKKLVKIWDANTGEEKASIKGHGDSVNSVTFSRNGRQLLSASFDGTAKIWDSKIRNEPTVLNYFGPIAFSQNGRYVAIRGTQENQITVWDIETSKVQCTFSGHTDKVKRIVMSSDGRYVASASESNDAIENNQLLKVWEADAGRELYSLPKADSGFRDFVFSTDAKLLATTTALGKDITFWEADSGHRLSSLNVEEQQLSVVYSPCGKQFAVFPDEPWGRVGHIWDAVSHQNVFKLEGHKEDISCIVYSPDGARIATSSYDKTAIVWDASTGRELFSLKGHTESVVAVAYHPREPRLATASVDGTLRIWDSENGRELISLSCASESSIYNSRLTFSPDGDCLLIEYAHGQVQIWSKSATLPDWFQQSR